MFEIIKPNLYVLIDLWQYCGQTSNEKKKYLLLNMVAEIG